MRKRADRVLQLISGGRNKEKRDECQDGSNCKLSRVHYRWLDSKPCGEFNCKLAKCNCAIDFLNFSFPWMCRAGWKPVGGMVGQGTLELCLRERVQQRKLWTVHQWWLNSSLVPDSLRTLLCNGHTCHVRTGQEQTGAQLKGHLACGKNL